MNFLGRINGNVKNDAMNLSVVGLRIIKKVLFVFLLEIIF